MQRSFFVPTKLLCSQMCARSSCVHVLPQKRATTVVELSDHFWHLQGKHVEAEPLYREAITIWKKVHGEEHPQVATGLNNLAELLRAQVSLSGKMCARPFSKTDVGCSSFLTIFDCRRANMTKRSPSTAKPWQLTRKSTATRTQTSPQASTTLRCFI